MKNYKEMDRDCSLHKCLMLALFRHRHIVVSGEALNSTHSLTHVDWTLALSLWWPNN